MFVLQESYIPFDFIVLSSFLLLNVVFCYYYYYFHFGSALGHLETINYYLLFLMFPPFFDFSSSFFSVLLYPSILLLPFCFWVKILPHLLLFFFFSIKLMFLTLFLDLFQFLISSSGVLISVRSAFMSYSLILILFVIKIGDNLCVTFTFYNIFLYFLLFLYTPQKTNSSSP